MRPINISRSIAKETAEGGAGWGRLLTGSLVQDHRGMGDFLVCDESDDSDIELPTKIELPCDECVSDLLNHGSYD